MERVRALVLDTLSLFSDPNNLLLLLFGSRVESDKPTADLDLLIFYSKPIADEVFLKIKESLDLIEDIPCKIDLLEGVKLKDDFLLRALTGAKIWHIGKDYLKDLKTLTKP